MNTRGLHIPRYLNSPKIARKDYVMTVSHQVLATEATRAEAIAISDFARRPLYWGNEVINGHYSN